MPLGTEIFTLGFSQSCLSLVQDAKPPQSALHIMFWVDDAPPYHVSANEVCLVVELLDVGVSVPVVVLKTKVLKKQGHLGTCDNPDGGNDRVPVRRWQHVHQQAKSRQRANSAVDGKTAATLKKTVTTVAANVTKSGAGNECSSLTKHRGHGDC